MGMLEVMAENAAENAAENVAEQAAASREAAMLAVRSIIMFLIPEFVPHRELRKPGRLELLTSGASKGSEVSKGSEPPGSVHKSW
jgi:hypothetical protein